jgi:hypothetical protein
MKLAATITIAAMMATMAASAQGKSESERQVTVYFSDNAGVPYDVRAQAQGLATEMFASIGVTLHLKPGHPAQQDADAIMIEFVTNTPATRHPGALAYALPYEGVHIRIFWDRIQPNPAPRQLLAQVMVHEITHILQGIDRHSNAGIMKAQWTREDSGAMKVKPLGFTQEDVDLIYNGMAARSAHATRPAALLTITSAAMGADSK